MEDRACGWTRGPRGVGRFVHTADGDGELGVLEASVDYVYGVFKVVTEEEEGGGVFCIIINNLIQGR